MIAGQFIFLEKPQIACISVKLIYFQEGGNLQSVSTFFFLTLGE